MQLVARNMKENMIKMLNDSCMENFAIGNNKVALLQLTRSTSKNYEALLKAIESIGGEAKTWQA